MKFAIRCIARRIIPAIWPGIMAQMAAPAPQRSGFHSAFPYDQGRVMGGGSSVNSMVAIRGMPGDFEEWVDAGASGWGWDDVLKYYKRLKQTPISVTTRGTVMTDLFPSGGTGGRTGRDSVTQLHPNCTGAASPT